MKNERENFSSNIGLILAMAGSAIGLGNIWRFPYMVGEYGGAAFILIYILCSLLLSLPIFFAEFIIGRRSGANAIGAIKKLAPHSGWKVLGWISVLTPLIIVSYYSVVGGWSLEYLIKAIKLDYTAENASTIQGMFGSFISNPWKPLIVFTAYLAIALFIVAFGVKKGIELFSKVSTPILFVLVVAIAIFACTLDGAADGVAYLVKPDFSKITVKTCAYALGQSFYSLSLGMGIIITYSSYADKNGNMASAGIATAISDLLFAIIAGFAIFPAVFAAGIEPGSGPGLIFDTLPYIFSQMNANLHWLSSVVAILFFLTILVAALTSTVSLLEVGVAWLVEERNFKRSTACVLIFCFTWVVGCLCSLSFGPLAGFTIDGKGLFDFLDAFSSNFLLTIGGILGVLFVGWKMKKADVKEEFTNGGKLAANSRLFNFIYFTIRYIAPIAIAVIFISNFIF